MAKVEEVLNKCIDQIMTGSRSVEECLAEHPSLSEELKPILQLALELREQPAAAMSSEAKERVRQRVMGGIRAERDAHRTWRSRVAGLAFGRAMRKGHILAGATIAALLIAALTGAGAAYASQDSIPGDVLYPMKRGLERVRLSLTGDELSRAKLHLAFADRRIDEAMGMTERSGAEGLDGLLTDYTQELQAASEAAGVDPGGSLAVSNATIEELLTLLEEATRRHTDTLNKALAQAPEAAEAGLQRALVASQRGQDQASGDTQGRGRGSTMGKGPATPARQDVPKRGGKKTSPTASSTIQSAEPPEPPDSTHPVGSRLAQLLDTPYEEIADLHEAGIGFGEIKTAFDLAQILADSQLNWQTLLAMHQSSQGWGEIVIAYKLAERLDDPELTGDTLLEMKTEGQGWGEIMMASRLAGRPGISTLELLELKDSGMGWGEIMREYGIKETGKPSR